MTRIIQALGLVFGDIGTSPIYTMTVIFLILEPTESNIVGVLSLIFWTLIFIPTIQYNLLAMRLSIRGEGGVLVITEIIKSLLRSTRLKNAIVLLSFISLSFFIGDGVITPAISILSAVEGITVIPRFAGMPQATIVLIAVLIAVLLFTFQKAGTEKVSFTFGPVMLVWFASLFLLGVYFISESPQVLKAINPLYAIEFLFNNGWKGFLVLGEVVLCVTGAEAMYSDIGHLGKKPIQRAWIFVFTALSINYLGQGAFLLAHPNSKNILFEMAFNIAPFLYIPFLILTILATVIASQALISGMFSVVYQAIATRIMPTLKITHTSTELMSQIYISSVNWLLLIGVVFTMIVFGKSAKLAAAYGLTVIGTMTITGLMMTSIFFIKRQYLFAFLAIIATFIDITFLISSLHKIPHGGYLSIIIAFFPFTVILLFTEGQKRLYKAMDLMQREEFIKRFELTYKVNPKIPGTAVFLLRDTKEIPPYIVETMFSQGIIYEDNIFLSVVIKPNPFGVSGFFKENLCHGIRVFEIQAGYMEVINVEDILRQNGVEERVIFYGLEDINARSFIWKAYSFIKRVTPNFISLLKLPSKKLHGVLTRIEM